MQTTKRIALTLMVALFSVAPVLATEAAPTTDPVGGVGNLILLVGLLAVLSIGGIYIARHIQRND
jgi:hypothetical protein